MRYSADRLISLNEFFKDIPLFDKVRTDRLIENVYPERPYCMHDRVRKLLRTGIVPLYICKQLGISIPGAFRVGNVGVLKGMDVLAFKELDILELSAATDVIEINGYDQFLHFFKDLVCRYVSPEALSQMPGGFGRLLKVLEMPISDDEDVVYNAAFWPNLLLETMFFEFHRLLREELPARGLGHKALKIIQAIDQHHPHFKKACADNDLLISWAGVHSKRSGLVGMDTNSKKALHYEGNGEAKEFSDKLLHALHSLTNTGEGEKNRAIVEALDSIPSEGKVARKFSTKVYRWKRRCRQLKRKQQSMEKLLLKAFQESGMLKDLQMPSSEPKESTDDMKTPPQARVVDTHRHGVVHAIKSDNVDLCGRMPEVNQINLEDEPYEHEDIVDLFTYKFPEYPAVCVSEFSRYCLWYKLQLRKRFPIPSIFCPNTNV